MFNWVYSEVYIEISDLEYFSSWPINHTLYWIEYHLRPRCFYEFSRQEEQIEQKHGKYHAEELSKLSAGTHGKIGQADGKSGAVEVEQCLKVLNSKLNA